VGWGRADRLKKYTTELVALGPDLIVTEGSLAVAPLLQATRSIPIVFTNVVDPVGSGYVASLSHPGGNATGFTQFEYRISGKWFELLREVAPSVSRVAVIRDPRIGPGIGQFAVIQAMAPELVELFPVDPLSTARAYRLRALGERRIDRDFWLNGICSRSDHRTCFATPAPRYLSVPLFCTIWRFDFLRT